MSSINENYSFLNDVSKEEKRAYLAFIPKLQGTNLNKRTFLATDYLNLFNEVVMLLEMAVDMPEMMEECRLWQPKSYEQHFLDSKIADREVAIKAYAAVLSKFKEPFEAAISRINVVVTDTINNADTSLSAGDLNKYAHIVTSGVSTIKELLMVADGTIHGVDKRTSLNDIDVMSEFK